MSSTSNRVAVKQHLRDLFTAHLADLNLKVFYSIPNNIPDRCVYFGPIAEGEIEIPALQSGRKQRDDRFTISWCADVYRPGDADCEQADIDVEAIWAEIDSLLADPTISGAGPKLGGHVEGLLVALLGSVEGPHGYQRRGPNNEPLSGWASTVVGEIECWSRLS